MAQSLLVYLSSEFAEEDVVALGACVHMIGAAQEWSLGAPQFVDETDDGSCSRPEDQPVRTVGVLLAVYSTGEAPETPVSEPRYLLEVLAVFSRERGVDFEVQLDDNYVGEIRGGRLDRLLREGLLDRW